MLAGGPPRALPFMPVSSQRLLLQVDVSAACTVGIYVNDGRPTLCERRCPVSFVGDLLGHLRPRNQPISRTNDIQPAAMKYSWLYGYRRSISVTLVLQSTKVTKQPYIAPSIRIMCRMYFRNMTFDNSWFAQCWFSSIHFSIWKKKHQGYVNSKCLLRAVKIKLIITFWHTTSGGNLTLASYKFAHLTINQWCNQDLFFKAKIKTKTLISRPRPSLLFKTNIKTFLWCILEADRKAFFIFGRKRKCRRKWNSIYGRKQNEN